MCVAHYGTKVIAAEASKVSLIMIVGVTGGTGFIGRRLVGRLVSVGHAVRVLTRRCPCEYSWLNGVEPVVGDLLNGCSVLRRFTADLDVLYHCAGEVSDESRMYDVHVRGTANLIQSFKNNVGHWVQLSSVGAYGPPAGAVNASRVVTELHPISPVGVYETTKTESDHLVLEAAHSSCMTCTILRPSNVFGREMPNNSLRALISIVKKGLFFYVGAPGAIANYVHVDDVVDALLLCASDEKARGQVYNLSADCQLADLIDGIALALGVKCPRKKLPERVVRAVVGALPTFISLPLTKSRIDALVNRTSYPPKKIEEELNFKPSRYVPEAIAELI